MNITSPAFSEGETIPVKYTCRGENISPPFEFSNIPPDTKSLVLTVEDADSGPPVWVHWFVFNIPPDTSGAGEGEVPPGSTEGFANGNTFGYEGPCSKYFKGKHRYQFNLYALSLRIMATPTVNKADIADIIADHILSRATLTGVAEGEKA